MNVSKKYANFFNVYEGIDVDESQLRCLCLREWPNIPCNCSKDYSVGLLTKCSEICKYIFLDTVKTSAIF